MRNQARTLSEHDPTLLKKLGLIEQGYLAVVVLIALLTLYGGLIPPLARLLPSEWIQASPQISLACLLSAAGLELTRPRHTEKVKMLGALLGACLALLGGASLLEYLLHISLGLKQIAVALGGTARPQDMPALTAAAFMALAFMLILSPARKGAATLAPDIFVSVFCLLVLVILRGYLFEGMANPGNPDRSLLLTLLSLSLLGFVAFMHRAETGVFSTLLGEGSGSRIARIAAPLVLLVPFLPQTALAHVVESGRVRSEYVSAMATFFASGVILAMMLYMAWKINQLESKVRELALRDEVSGMLNRRGFHLVAWQALRQARRYSQPFSILLVDLDNLEDVYKNMGAQVGAEYLSEMGDVMTATFRSTDVIGRIDPTQLALAGSFDEKATAIMRLRLKEAVNYRNSNLGKSFTITMSIRSVNATDPRQQSLEDLLALADIVPDQEPASRAESPR
jgi:diguanylate cyclase (GGDEF)-like protein